MRREEAQGRLSSEFSLHGPAFYLARCEGHNGGVRRFLAAAVLLLWAPVFQAGPERPRPAPSALLGLAFGLDEPSAAADSRAADEARRSGATVFGLTVSWSASEPAPGKYSVSEITRTARLLRQSGATLHIDLPLVVSRTRDVPADLAGFAFDDERLSRRLGRLFDALEPVFLDASTLSLGYEADAYFSDKPEDLKAYRALFDGAVQYLRGKVPHLSVGVTTAAPSESVAPLVAAALHARSPVLFYIYAPFQRGRPFEHRAPEAIDRDWKQLLDRAAGRPIAFPEVSYSSSQENASSPEKQAEFVRRLRRLVASTDGRRLLFARYATWRDPPASAVRGASETAKRRDAFLKNRGLQEADGRPKPAWREWAKMGR